jgi:lipoate-protein ligase B
MRVIDLDTMPYRQAWAEQERHHAEVAAGGEPRILVVEHPPVITLGRRAETARSHLVASEAQLKKLKIDVVESDRGGDITYHGPGQIVVYPIIKLADFGLSVGGYVHRLEQAMVDCLEVFKLKAHTEPGAVGTWVEYHGKTAKVGAIGVRVKQGCTLHGLALNVETDLTHFGLIVPCGLEGRPVTSLQSLLRDACPSYVAVRSILVGCVQHAIERRDPPKPDAGATPPADAAGDAVAE